MFTPVRTRRTFEEALEQITDAIRAGDLRVGDRLPSERTLAAEMGISRPTLREAIKILAEAGVINVIAGPGGGTFVRQELIPSDLIAARTEFKITEVSGVLETRRLFEPRVAQLAGFHATEEDFAALQRTIDLQRECAADRERFVQLDSRFHIAMARATKNETTVYMMRALWKRLEIARDMAFRGKHEPERALEIHEDTLAAIKTGDPDRIDAAMDEHLSHVERIWEDESGRPQLRRIPEFLLPHGLR
jgi:GntR family transcriptional regulator, transcriptional repressor for pyruvate dehydrogenase complex